MAVNCSGLDNRQGSFATYIAKLANATGGDFANAAQCKTEVCTALWGDGNPDISGIGMTVGYVCSFVLGAGIAAFYIAAWKLHHLDEAFARRILFSLDDCATFFAFSIQIASIVVLARVDYGLSAACLGDITVRITWTVSVLTLLPLLYALLLHGILEPSLNKDRPKPVNEASPVADRRTLLFCICWSCAVYPFMSRMIEAFGASSIGDGPGDVISNHHWNILQDICLAGTAPPSEAEYRLINATGIISFLLVSMLAVSKIVVSGLRRHHHEAMHHLAGRAPDFEKILIAAKCGLLAMVPVLSVVLIWSYIKLQRFQNRVAHALGTQDTDNQWGFGQVVSVVVFFPVFVEAFFDWYERRKEAGEEEEVAEVAEVEMAESYSPDTSSDAETVAHLPKISGSRCPPSAHSLQHGPTWP